MNYVTGKSKLGNVIDSETAQHLVTHPEEEGYTEA